MFYWRKEEIILAKNFTKNCDENKIWYTLDSETLLGAVRHGGFLPWDISFNVLMTTESFAKLARLFPKNVMDSTTNRSFKMLNAYFLEDISKSDIEQPFIKIRILVPTTIKKLNKFNNKVSYFMGYLLGHRDSLKRAINELKSKNDYDGYYAISERFTSSKKSWSNVFTTERTLIKFINMNVFAPKNYEYILASWYGADYMNVIMPNHYFVYKTPINKVKIKY